MKSKFKDIIRAIIYLSIIFFILAKLDFLFSPMYTDVGYFKQATSQKELYDIKDNTIEVVFTGNSKCTSGIDPVYIYKKSGIKSFNRANLDSPVLDSYYQTVEAFKKHKIKYVFLEGDTILCGNHTNRLFPTLTEDFKLKAEFYLDKDSPESKRQFLNNMSNIYLFHDRWRTIKQSDFEKIVKTPPMNKLNYRGCRVFLKTGNVPVKELEEKKKAFKNEGKEKVKIDPHNLNVIKRFQTLCNENGAEFYIFLLPMTSDKKLEYRKAELTKLCKENNIKYLDLTNGEIKIDNKTDYADKGDHYNYLGMEKASEYFVDFLKDDKTLNREKDSDWDKIVEKEEKYIKDGKQ